MLACPAANRFSRSASQFSVFASALENIRSAFTSATALALSGTRRMRSSYCVLPPREQQRTGLTESALRRARRVWTWNSTPKAQGRSDELTGNAIGCYQNSKRISEFQPFSLKSSQKSFRADSIGSANAEAFGRTAPPESATLTVRYFLLRLPVTNTTDSHNVHR